MAENLVPFYELLGLPAERAIRLEVNYHLVELTHGIFAGKAERILEYIEYPTRNQAAAAERRIIESRFGEFIPKPNLYYGRCGRGARYIDVPLIGRSAERLFGAK
ncbi:MAG TPA: hypothetical protein VGG34_05120 [Opitutaceae bacterium]